MFSIGSWTKYSNKVRNFFVSRGNIEIIIYPLVRDDDNRTRWFAIRSRYSRVLALAVERVKKWASRGEDKKKKSRRVKGKRNVGVFLAKRISKESRLFRTLDLRFDARDRLSLHLQFRPLSARRKKNAKNPSSEGRELTTLDEGTKKTLSATFLFISPPRPPGHPHSRRLGRRKRRPYTIYASETNRNAAVL